MKLTRPFSVCRNGDCCCHAHANARAAPARREDGLFLETSRS
jgi:hypothetical protein